MVQFTPVSSGDTCDNAYAELKAVLADMSSDFNAAAKLARYGSSLGLRKRGSIGTCINLR